MIKNQKKLSQTFHFCEGCPADKNCCTGKTVDLPTLTPKDIRIISKKTGFPVNEFAIPTNDSLFNMKSNGGKCYFYKNDRCAIYKFRPVDCRLFPFDIRKNDKKELILVWYSTACPKLINPEPYKENAKLLLPFLSMYLEEFVNHSSPLLDKHEYKFVEKITPIKPILIDVSG